MLAMDELMQNQNQARATSMPMQEDILCKVVRHHSPIYNGKEEPTALQGWMVELDKLS